nr:MAG TPA: hypothetical protein [Caudoviricetes sp.]
MCVFLRRSSNLCHSCRCKTPSSFWLAFRR